MLDEAKEIVDLGEALNALYSRCWGTCVDCYQRHFQGREQSDRDAIVQMTNFLYASCIEALLNKNATSGGNEDTSAG